MPNKARVEIPAKFAMPPRWGKKLDLSINRISDEVCEKCERNLSYWYSLIIGFIPMFESGDPDCAGKVIIQCPRCKTLCWMYVTESDISLIRKSVERKLGYPRKWPTCKDGRAI